MGRAWGFALAPFSVHLQQVHCSTSAPRPPLLSVCVTQHGMLPTVLLTVQAAAEDLTQLGPKTEADSRKRQRIEAMAGKLPAVLAALRADQAQQAQQAGAHGAADAAAAAAAAVDTAARREAEKPAVGLKEVVEAAVEQTMPEAAAYDVAHEGALGLLGLLRGVMGLRCAAQGTHAWQDHAHNAASQAQDKPMQHSYSNRLPCSPHADDAFSDTEGEQAPGGGDAELVAAADAAQLPSDLASLRALLAELPWWVDWAQAMPQLGGIGWSM